MTKRVWLIVLLLGFLLLLGWKSISTFTFFTSDTGLRFIQAKALLDNQFQSIAIDYTGRVLDHEFENVPFYSSYIIVNDEVLLRIPPYFPLIAALLYTTFGKFGMLLPSVLGGFASALALYKVTQISELRRPLLLLWAVVIATPVLFYSIEFWDHTFVMAFSLWAMTLLITGVVREDNRFVAAAGVLAAWAWVQRAEYAVFVAALGLALLAVTRVRVSSLVGFAVGNLLGAIPLWVIQSIWIGHPLGITYAPVLFGYGIPDRYPSASFHVTSPLTRVEIVSRFVTYIESHDAATFMATIFCIAGLFLIVFALRLPRWRKRSILLAGFGLSLMGYTLWSFIGASIPITGIISTMALLPFSLAVVETNSAAGPADRIYRFVLITTFAFLSVMFLIWPTYGGRQWGSRYLLPAYPLLTYLAFYAFEHYADGIPALRRSLTLVFSGLLLLSVLVQLSGAHMLLEQHRGEVAVRDNFRELPVDVVVTNNPYLVSFLASVDKMFLYVEDGSDLDYLVPRMWKQGIDAFTVAQVINRPLQIPDQVDDITIREVEPFIYELEGPSEIEGGLQP